MSKAYTYFLISGTNWDTNLFTDIIGILPTSIRENRISEKLWEYKIEAADIYEGVEVALTKLIDILLPKSTIIRHYTEKHNLYVKVFVVIESEDNYSSDGVFFNHSFLTFLNEVGAEIEIEIYK